MPIIRIRAATAALFLACIIAGTATISTAQNIPSGACVVPGGWCWPLVPAPSGSPCECRTQRGTFSGVIQ
ncbi:MAG: hypothetical protein ABJ320_18920 [Lentilitoribacter sp.]